MSSQADPPTLKNLDFASAGARFSKNQGIRYKDAFDGVLGLSWARFGCSWGLLGGSFPAFWDSRRLLEFSKLLFLAPLSPHLGSQGAIHRPKELPKRPHGETDGPTKLPRPIWRRISTSFPSILMPKSRKKERKNHLQSYFEATCTSRVLLLLLLLLLRLLILLLLLLLLNSSSQLFFLTLLDSDSS